MKLKKKNSFLEDIKDIECIFFFIKHNMCNLKPAKLNSIAE